MLKPTAVLLSAKKPKKSGAGGPKRHINNALGLKPRYHGKITSVQKHMPMCSEQQVGLINCLARNNFQLKNCLLEKTIFDACADQSTIRDKFTGNINFHLKRYGKQLL